MWDVDVVPPFMEGGLSVTVRHPRYSEALAGLLYPLTSVGNSSLLHSQKWQRPRRVKLMQGSAGVCLHTPLPHPQLCLRLATRCQPPCSSLSVLCGRVRAASRCRLEVRPRPKQLSAGQTDLFKSTNSPSMEAPGSVSPRVPAQPLTCTGHQFGPASSILFHWWSAS